MTEKIIVVDLETFRSGDQTAIQQKQVLLEALADTSKVISNIEIKGNQLLITYADGGSGDACTGSLCGAVTVDAPGRGLDISIKSDTPSHANGKGSFAMGSGCTADGDYSFAMGSGSISNNKYSTAIGRLCKAGGFSSVALGYGCNTMDDIFVKGTKKSANYEGISMGYECYVGPGEGSVAMGNQCSVLKGHGAVAMGKESYADSNGAIAMGINCYASGTTAGNGIAMGSNCKATANHAVAIGSNNYAYAADSTCMGELNKTGNEGEFACGWKNLAGGGSAPSKDGYVGNQMFSVGIGNKLDTKAGPGEGKNLFSIGYGYLDEIGNSLDIKTKTSFVKGTTYFSMIHLGENYIVAPQFTPTSTNTGKVTWVYLNMNVIK